MSEEHGPYSFHNGDDAAEGVERISDVLRRLVVDRGWPLSVGAPRVNGSSPGTHEDRGRGDA